MDCVKCHMDERKFRVISRWRHIGIPSADDVTRAPSQSVTSEAALDTCYWGGPRWGAHTDPHWTKDTKTLFMLSKCLVQYIVFF